MPAPAARSCQLWRWCRWDFRTSRDPTAIDRPSIPEKQHQIYQSYVRINCISCWAHANYWTFKIWVSVSACNLVLYCSVGGSNYVKISQWRHAWGLLVRHTVPIKIVWWQYQASQVRTAKWLCAVYCLNAVWLSYSTATSDVHAVFLDKLLITWLSVPGYFYV